MMRLLGTTLMGFGAFCLSVVLASVLGPMLRSLGIDIQAETTSVVGTAMIGVFSLTTGMLLRRRVAEAVRRSAPPLPTEQGQHHLPPAPAETLQQQSLGAREQRKERR